MKLTIVSTLLVVFSVSILPARAQEGFADKAEAKNEFREGLKSGKWCTWLDNNGQIVTDAGGAAYYSLAVYHGGKPSGKVRQYDLSDRLVSENLYFDGKLNEMRSYHVNGKLYLEIPYNDGKKNGIVKEYYESGILSSETPYINGYENGIKKSYFGSGVLMNETPYINGCKSGTEKNYNEDGSIKNEVNFHGGKAYARGAVHARGTKKGHRRSAKRPIHKPKKK